MRLTEEDFLKIIDKTPLVSIDLVIRDSSNRILMGNRTNEPAKNYWFVPGGRILKNENIETAFKRISIKELKQNFKFSEAKLFNVYDHFYESNFANKSNITTQYVVLALELIVSHSLKETIVEGYDDQHSSLKWISENDTSNNVHKNSKAYFATKANINDLQYEILNSRRDSFNNLVWQTPVLSLTAQAFLFTIIYTSNASEIARTIVAVLSIILALASIQLLMKHRYMETEHAKLLHKFEKNHSINPINRMMPSSSKLVNLSSYKIWVFALISVLIGAALSIPIIWVKYIIGE